MREIDEIKATGLPLDTYWVDAGWYGPPGTRCADKRTPDWAYYVGWYEPDVSRYPNGMREVSDYSRANGMRFVLWLEPDRAVVGSPAQTAHRWTPGAIRTSRGDAASPRSAAWRIFTGCGIRCTRAFRG